MVTTGKLPVQQTFLSSGTAGLQRSKHYISSLDIYKQSLFKSFEIFFGRAKEITLLALLPSYLQQGDSSLVWMVAQLMSESGQKESGYYLNNYGELQHTLLMLKEKKSKCLLIGVSYALLEMAEKHPVQFPELMVMETGGMKGRRKEIIREELHKQLQIGFGTNLIYSEYGMTELLSQAYAMHAGLFETPPWMQVFIRDVNDPFTLVKNGKTGGINIIDLANVFSCSFIATQDLGRKNPLGQFEVLGRFDHSDVRGCNLLV